MTQSAKPTTSQEWAKYIAEKYGCIHDTTELLADIFLIRHQAQCELNDIENFLEGTI